MTQPTTAAEAIKETGFCMCLNSNEKVVYRFSEERKVWLNWIQQIQEWDVSWANNVHFSSFSFLPCPDPSKPEPKEPERVELKKRLAEHFNLTSIFHSGSYVANDGELGNWAIPCDILLDKMAEAYELGQKNPPKREAVDVEKVHELLNEATFLLGSIESAKEKADTKIIDAMIALRELTEIPE